MAIATSTRLSKEQRREQLLDTAATLLADRGAAALTMEGLAAAAGVSKALPYGHFDNADAVQSELFGREMLRLGRAVLEAMEPEPLGPGRLAAAIGAYFDYVEPRGALLSVLTANPTVASSGDVDTGPDFVAGLLVDSLDLAPETAAMHARFMLGVLDGATSMWARGLAERSALEPAVVDFVLAGVTAAAPSTGPR